MKRILLLMFTIILVLNLSCDSSDSDSELNYTLRIVNDFGISLNVYLDAGDSNDGFQDQGIIPAQGEILINDMNVGVTYVLRGVEVGGIVENWVYQEEFINNSTSTRQVTVTIR